MRPTIALASGAIALVVITGCAANAPDASEPPSPAPTSATATAEPTSEPTDEPSSAPTATPSRSPSASPSPSASDDDDARYCGDDYVRAMLARGLVTWPGTIDEQLEMAEPQGMFEPAEALDDLDVVCVATYRMPTDGTPGVVVISEAVVEQGDDVFEELEMWAEEAGYESRSGETGFVEREAPLNPDGTSTMKVFWAPLDGVNPTIGNAAEIIELTGAEPDAVLVVHSDFTQD